MSSIGLLGDVHAEDRYLEIALRFFAERAVTQILCTGDIVDGPGSVQRCISLLIEFEVLTVAGNHDRWILEDRKRTLPEATLAEQLDPASRSYLESLPTVIELQIGEHRALLCHGMLDNDMSGVHPDDFGYALETNDELQALLTHRHYDIIINGHTHRRMVRDFEGLTIVNAGTLKTEHDPGFGLLDTRTAELHWYDLGPGEEVLGPDRQRMPRPLWRQ